MKTIPYTTSTGVKIGSRWNESPKPMPIDDPDMEFIQGVFIHSGKWHRQKRIEKYSYAISSIATLFLIVIYTAVSK